MSRVSESTATSTEFTSSADGQHALLAFADLLLMAAGFAHIICFEPPV
jgi:hypothetical protein